LSIRLLIIFFLVVQSILL